jgi:hypothetical protein
VAHRYLRIETALPGYNFSSLKQITTPDEAEGERLSEKLFRPIPLRGLAPPGKPLGGPW